MKTPLLSFTLIGLFCLLTAMSCNNKEMKSSSNGIPKNALFIGSWKESYEENTGNYTVFRPESFSFPPSRYRQGIQFNTDGTGKSTVLSSNDAHTLADITWVATDAKTITIQGKAEEIPKIFTIVEVSADILKVIVKQ